jgi:WD40 repeat protein
LPGSLHRRHFLPFGPEAGNTAGEIYQLLEPAKCLKTTDLVRFPGVADCLARSPDWTGRPATDRPSATATFSPDGRWLAAGDSSGTIQLWEAATGQEGRSFQQKATVSALHWLDANQVLSAAGDRTGALYLLRQDVAGSEQK